MVFSIHWIATKQAFGYQLTGLGQRSILCKHNFTKKL